MDNLVIEVKNLKKSYNKAKKIPFEAVKGITFSVEKGEIFGILGPNGAGKTTTLEIIECLNTQTSGQVTVLGFDNIKESTEIKKSIGAQLQSSDYFPNLTLGELLDLFYALYDTESPYNKKTLLKLVGLEQKEDERVKNLSGGQKQRFTIATSLVNNPKILFLDEPTTGLDPLARRNLWQLIKQLNQEGLTIILTTHYMEEAEFLCSRVAIMDEGRILEIEHPKKLIDKLSSTTQISFLVDQQIDNSIFDNLPEVKKVYSKYPKIIVEVKSLEDINTIVEVLKTNKISFSGFTVKTASLEDVYLYLTGKEFSG